MQHYFIDKEHAETDFFEFNDNVIGLNLCFRSCDSIFSKNKIDDGTRALLEAINEKPPIGSVSLESLMKRPAFTLAEANKKLKLVKGYSREVIAAVDIDTKYAGYLARQNEQIERERKLEEKKIPEDLDFMKLEGLRLEAREKLNKIKPLTVGMASRISGVSPADITVLLMYLK